MATMRAVFPATMGIQAFNQSTKSPTEICRALSAFSREKSLRKWQNRPASNADFLGGSSFTCSRRKRNILANGGMLEWGESPAASLAAVAAAAIGGAATIAMEGGFGGNREAARASVRRGMELFVENDVQGSVVEFDRALQLDPSQEPYLWQRGLSLYYLGKFQEAAEQFRKDVAVNPNDTEEVRCGAVRCIVVRTPHRLQLILEFGSSCGFPSPLPKPPSPASSPSLIPKLGPHASSSPPPPGSPFCLSVQILAAAAADFGRPSALFYANLYVGLFYESEGDQDQSRRYILEAAQSPYGLRSGDYMAALARVHCLQRGWLPGGNDWLPCLPACMLTLQKAPSSCTGRSTVFFHLCSR
ncbi:unnamed protein product [Closterium sp. NIES-54]